MFLNSHLGFLVSAVWVSGGLTDHFLGLRRKLELIILTACFLNYLDSILGFIIDF